MPKALKIILLVILIVTVGFNALCFAFDMFSPDFDNLPDGTLIHSSNSPTDAYTVRFYRCGSGGVRPVSIKGEVTNNLSDETIPIYWNRGEDIEGFYWISETIISVGGYTFDFSKDTYDWRTKRVNEELLPWTATNKE